MCSFVVIIILFLNSYLQLFKYIQENPIGSWTQYLPLLINQSNARSMFFLYSTHSGGGQQSFLLSIVYSFYIELRATGYTPYEVIFGRKSKLFLRKLQDQYEETSGKIKNYFTNTLFIYI